MTNRLILLACVILAEIVVVTACGGSSAPATGSVERTIYMAAVEPKGSTTVDKEPFPAAALPEGDGYGLIEPDAEGQWTVETYRFEPGTVVVHKGDVVTLEVVGINGKEHLVNVEGYDVSGAVKRGEVTRLTFPADKSGIFRIICTIHQPTMTSDLIVLADN